MFNFKFDFISCWFDFDFRFRTDFDFISISLFDFISISISCLISFHVGSISISGFEPIWLSFRFSVIPCWFCWFDFDFSCNWFQYKPLFSVSLVQGTLQTCSSDHGRLLGSLACIQRSWLIRFIATVRAYSTWSLLQPFLAQNQVWLSYILLKGRIMNESVHLWSYQIHWW